MSDRNQNDTGKNMGQGLDGVNDNQSHDLMDRGSDQRTQDQRDVKASSQRTDESGKAKDDVSRAPESGTP